MARSRIAALIVVAVALGLALEAGSRIAPALQDGWPSLGMAGRVFLPLVVLVVLAVWLWRR